MYNLAYKRDRSITGCPLSCSSKFVFQGIINSGRTNFILIGLSLFSAYKMRQLIPIKIFDFVIGYYYFENYDFAKMGTSVSDIMSNQMNFNQRNMVIDGIVDSVLKNFALSWSGVIVSVSGPIA